MSVWEALVLGVIQGATEFLPVSSSGHLVIGQALLGVQLPGIAFEVAVHVATLASVLLVYRERVGALFLGALRREREAWRYVGFLLLASVPAGVVGVFFEDAIAGAFESEVLVAGALVVTGILLFSTRVAARREARPEGLTAGRALLVGVAQAFAITPGISRSGSTVVAALWLGIEAREAAAFSFLMSVPAIGGAALLKAPELLDGTSGMTTAALLAGSAAAAVTGVLAIRWFVVMLQKRAFHQFAYWCWGVAGAFALWLALR